MENPWKECAETLKEEKDHYAECDKGKIQGIVERIAKKKDKDGKVRLELPPQPFEGCVEKSKIVILTLNPGYKDGDEAQQSKKEFIEETTKCMLQKPDAKFFSLMDKFEKDNHYDWWNRHLIKKADDEIIEMFKPFGGYRKFLIKNLSVIEFFPYHSKKDGGVTCDYAEIESQKYSFELVKEAISENKIIIIQRSVKAWLKAVPELENYVNCYKCKNPRSPYISNNNLKKANGEEASLSDILKPFAY